MAHAEIGEGFGHAREQFDFLVPDGMREADDALAFFIGYRLGAEALEAGYEGAREAGQPVAARQDGFALHGVERVTHFGGRVHVVIEIADERGDGAFEIDIVLPEGIVRIDKQCLAGREAGHGFYGIEPFTGKAGPSSQAPQDDKLTGRDCFLAGGYEMSSWSHSPFVKFPRGRNRPCAKLACTFWRLAV